MKIHWYHGGQDTVRRVLAGENISIGNAFMWVIAEDGYEYWLAVDRNLLHGRGIPDEARAKLVAALLTGDI